MAIRTLSFQPSRKEFITGIVALSALACISMSRGTDPQSSSASTFSASPPPVQSSTPASSSAHSISFPAQLSP